MARFDGKIILISGGARGQGAAEARALVAEGAKVVIGDVIEDKGAALARELGKRRRVRAPRRHQRGRLGSRGRRRRKPWAGCTASSTMPASITPKPLMETDTELWDRHIRINQFGCFLGMKAVVPAMQSAGGGSIVNISSGAGLRGSPQAFAYSATKWALRGMTKSAAMDLAQKKIRVNSVHPGPIDTDMMQLCARLKRTPSVSRWCRCGGTGTRRRGRAAGAVPALRRERLHHRRRGRHRRRHHGIAPQGKLRALPSRAMRGFRRRLSASAGGTRRRPP